jgi:two-component system CheB/CheR fusion protein
MASKKKSSGRKGVGKPKASARKTSSPRMASRRAADDTGKKNKFPIVALGASAGGIGALDQFFSAMPPSTGMAFVVITHQHPTGPSLLPDILGRKTEMEVLAVTKPVRVEPNHVYTATPGFNLAIVDGVLSPQKQDRRGVPPMPVDAFFRSLAQDQEEFAIGIILSGTGADGSLGLKEIKASLGMVLAQDEQSAEYSAMPGNAAATELVDFVLPIAEMPKRLMAYQAALLQGQGLPVYEIESATEALQQIFVLLRSRTGHEFSQYKVSTMRRRIERRMNVHHIDTERNYLRYLQSNPGESELLFKELLIGVTCFFRDPDAWDALREKIQRQLEDKPNDYIYRAWLAGCSTGEEAYSLAILLRELMDVLKRSIQVQIFATDLDSAAIDTARTGTYPLGIANDLSQKRLSRFFVQEGDTYRVKQEIREMVVFAPQNLIADPPFTKLDLLSCRNLLIYLEGELQKKLIPIFHYALRPGALLLLGSSESISNFSELFVVLDKKWKLFQRRDVPPGTYSAEFPALRSEIGVNLAPRVPGPHPQVDFGFGFLADKVLLRDLVPPTVIVHERGEVVHIHGRTGLFLEPAPGSQSAPNIFNMARDGLQVSLSTAMRQAAAENKEIIHHGVELKGNGDAVSLDLRVRRISEPQALRGLLRISFVNSSPLTPELGAVEVRKQDRTEELERELQYTRETQQSTLEQLETANEELKSTNEEMQSTNEELQSTNEELETSKEEMQSLNEELQTLNSELQDKVEELSRANNDMKNLLNATNIATIFLDNDLNIKRFTEQAKKVIRLIPSDVGRPIGDLVSTLHYDHLVEDATEVLRTLVFKETEVKGDRDAWYLMRILPYRTVENVIDGLVLTFVDITVVRALQYDQRRLLDGLKNSPTCIFGQDLELRYTWVSGELFGREPALLEGKTDAEVFGPRDARDGAELKMNVLKTGTVQRRKLTMQIGRTKRVYQLNAEPARDSAGAIIGVLCVATDITETSDDDELRPSSGIERAP